MPFRCDTVWDQKEHDILKWMIFSSFRTNFFFFLIRYQTLLLPSFHSRASVSPFLWLTKMKWTIITPEGERCSFSPGPNCLTFKRLCAKLPPSCLTRCDPVDCSPPGSSVHGILQARILAWVAFPSPGGLPDPGIEPAAAADSLPLSQQGSPIAGHWLLYNTSKTVPYKERVFTSLSYRKCFCYVTCKHTVCI